VGEDTYGGPSSVDRFLKTGRECVKPTTTHKQQQKNSSISSIIRLLVVGIVFLGAGLLCFQTQSSLTKDYRLSVKIDTGFLSPFLFFTLSNV
jgi:hypothetical protein